MSGLQTEFRFTLPKGYVDGDGTLHRRGTMRLATARDEIEPLRDPRVSDPDDPFLTIIVLSRVITELGTISQVTPREIEGLFAADLAFLQDFYGIANFGNPHDLAALQRSVLHTDQIVVDEPTISLEEEHAAGEPVAAAPAMMARVDESPTDGDMTGQQLPRRRGAIEEVKTPAS